MGSSSQDRAAKLPAEQSQQAAPPGRYVAYIFDDLHLDDGDLAAARNAFERELTELTSSHTRVAIYTTSRQTMLDFTDDAARLRDALFRIQPRSKTSSIGIECPNLSYYWADLIQNKNDAQALQAAVQETYICAHMDPKDTPAKFVEAQAQAAALRILSLGSAETRLSLRLLRDVVRRISTMPSQRSVVLVSPGFLVLDSRLDESDIIDLAIRKNVTIGALDARGLYTVTPSQPVDAVGDLPNLTLRSRYQKAGAFADEDSLAELADSTGGTFIHNSNGLDAGFRRIGSAPEYYYVLGFVPQDLKNDGSYHKLKVTLMKDIHGVTLQFRRGYFAPKHEVSAIEEAKREVEDALYSRDDWRDFPVDVETRFFKPSDERAKLSVLTRVDPRLLHFRVSAGRNVNTFLVASGVFDGNGNAVSAIEKTVDLNLKDATLRAYERSGMAITIGFDLSPGSYLVRTVVLDTEGHRIATASKSVDIP